MSKKPCSKVAIVDVDGTLVKGNLGRLLGIYLITLGLRKGVYSKQTFLSVFLKRAWMLLLLPFTFVEKIYFLLQREATLAFFDLLCQSDEEKLEELAKEAFREVRISKSARDFIRRLKENGYCVYLLSASPKQMVALLAEKLGVDGFVATDPRLGIVLDAKGKEKVVRERWGRVDLMVGNKGKEPFHLARRFYVVKGPRDLRKIPV